MNDERTIYDDEKKEYQRQEQETKQTETNTEPVSDNKKVPNKKPMWQRAAIGAGTGFAVGVGATVLTSGTTQEQALQQEQGENHVNGTTDGAAHPAWVDGEVSVATSVNDNMSFGEAFAAARAEVGAGGVFEWHGGIYNTYYEDEWASMSAADRAEFGSHFSWNDHHNDVADSQQHTVTNNEDSDDVVATVVEQPEDDDVVVTVVDEPGNDEIATGSVLSLDDDHEVQILGVVHDDSTGANMGGMMIDGHEAVVLDVDGDMTFDIIGIDVNDNHEFEESEQASISNEGLTVDAFTEQTEAQIEQTTDDYIVDAQPYDC